MLIVTLTNLVSKYGIVGYLFTTNDYCDASIVKQSCIDSSIVLECQNSTNSSAVLIFVSWKLVYKLM